MRCKHDDCTRRGIHIRLVLDTLPAFALRPAHGCADQALRADTRAGGQSQYADRREAGATKAKKAVRGGVGIVEGTWLGLRVGTCQPGRCPTRGAP